MNMALQRETSAGYLANWAARLFTRELERQLAPTGIAPAYMPVLFALADGGEMTQKQLARRAAVEQPTMAATLNRMERDGFLARRPDPADKRSALISLTETARGRIGTVEAVIARINAIALSGLKDKDRARLAKLMLKMIAALEAHDAAF